MKGLAESKRGARLFSRRHRSRRLIIPGIYDRAYGATMGPNLWGNDFYPLRAELEDLLQAPVRQLGAIGRAAYWRNNG